MREEAHRGGGGRMNGWDRQSQCRTRKGACIPDQLLARKSEKEKKIRDKQEGEGVDGSDLATGQMGRVIGQSPSHSLPN